MFENEVQELTLQLRQARQMTSALKKQVLTETTFLEPSKAPTGR